MGSPLIKGESIRPHGLVLAIDKVLNESSSTTADPSLHDRLLGITDPLDVKQSPSIQSHIVRFLTQQNSAENYTYLSTLLRDSVCWDILDILPTHTARILLNAVQKCSQFSFGLLVAERLKTSATNNELGYLYEAKFLVQLFRYADAKKALENTSISSESRLILHNMLLGQSLEGKAREITEEVFSYVEDNQYTEFDAVILRNSAHLFTHEEAITVVQASVETFKNIGSGFGTATSLNNLGVAQISAGDIKAAQKSLNHSLKLLQDLGSPEAYQPLVNLSSLAIEDGNYEEARLNLNSAREVLPKSLLMDVLMINANLIVLHSLETNKIDSEQYQRLKELHARSRKTSDVRFIDTLGYMVSQLDNCFDVVDLTEYSRSIVEKVLDTERSGMEVFFDLPCSSKTIKCPYFLSPHWRY